MSENESGVNSSISEQKQNFFVVGIGASAGGLRALEEFFEHMPTDSGAAFVVIQHLSPDFKSLMKELLERRTRMAIYRVTEGMELEPNSIYLIPPGKNLVLEHQKLHLLEQEERNRHGLNLPIDIFLESLAKTHEEIAIGVILSGTGSDGTNGLRAINEAGGFAMVQEPETAEFDGMPRTAIATGVVDRILSPSELAQAINQLVRSPNLPNQGNKERTEVFNVHSLQRIASILAQYEQTDFSHYKISTLSRRIHRRYLISGCQNIDEFIRLLESSAEERATLRHDLLISVTQFFRDRSAWDFLEKEVIPQLIAKADPQEEIRCWVTACATGEEAYSLAILLDEAVTKADRAVRFKIFATDIDKSALEKATQGIYPQTITNDINPERLERYFVRKDNSWQVIRKLREKLLFAPHDLTKDAGFTRMNLISCRNVLIYLQSDLQQQVLRNLHFSLASKGILFLGEAETLGYIETEFQHLDKKSKIYQKRRDIRLNVPVKGVEKISRQLLPNISIKDNRENRLEPMLDKAFSAFLSKYKATCFLVDREYRLFHTFNDNFALLKVPTGRTTTDITKMIVTELQLPLITALHRAKRERSPVSYLGIKIEREEQQCNLKLEVIYHESNKLVDDFLSIVIQEDETPHQSSGEQFEADAEASQRIMELEYELQKTRENLQAVIEELETTNEEQQATNEELTASNEELQSTNEELHSVNEELYTVNAEYQSKIGELTELNNDVDNLLRSTDIGVLFLDRDLKIRKFTPAATVAINLVEADINRPLEHITHNLDCVDLIELLKTVVESQNVLNKEVKLVKQDFHLLMRINTYLLEDGRLDGLVISFIDIDELKTIQQQINLVNEELKQSQFQLRQLNQDLEQRVEERTQALQRSETKLRAILETTSSIIYLKDLEGRYLLVNRQYLESFNLTEADILGQSDLDIFPKEIADVFLNNDRQVIDSKSVLDFEEQAIMPDGSLRTYISIKAPLISDRDQVYAICGISTDISQQKETEAELRESAARERTIIDVVEKIRHSLDLDEIFQATTEKLRETLKCDRVTLYRFNPDWSGEFVAESVGSGWMPLLGSQLQEGWTDTYLQKTQGGRYSQKETLAVEDIEQTDFSDCHRDIYRQIQAQAFCLAPIFQQEQLWGLLAAYQNNCPRQWKEGEIRLLTQTGIQLGISIEQVDLFTQIQTKKAAEIANQAKDVFISHMSHELRTPLNSILGFSNILRKELDSDPEKLHWVDIINQSGQHLLALINDILNFSKVSANKLELEPSEFNLIQFLNEIVNIFHLKAKQKKLTFSWQFLPSVPIAVSADKIRLRQVLLNLLSNAIKFTETGRVILKVGSIEDFQVVETEHIESQEELEVNNDSKISHSSSRMIRFQVEDTGRGIPNDKLADIFAPFEQLRSNTDKQEGTGLGLTISQNIIQLMGGQIQVESEVSQGSKFWFDLEIPEIKADLLPTSTKPVASTKRKLNVLRKILIVDDNDDNRTLLVKHLQSMGFTLMEASNGQEGLDVAEIFEPHAILTDLAMPVMDGSEMITRIKQQSHLQNTVIIAVSAHREFILKSSDIDCHDFLSKPINLEQLLEVLETHLQLDWQLSESTKESNQPSAVIAPEQQDLIRLLESVEFGDMEAIESQINSLEAKNSQYLPFVEEVRQLAISFQHNQLEQFIQNFIRD